MTPKQTLENIIELLKQDRKVGGLTGCVEQLSWMILLKLVEQSLPEAQYRIAQIIAKNDDELLQLVNHELFVYLLENVELSPLLSAFKAAENRIDSADALKRALVLVDSLKLDDESVLTEVAFNYEQLLANALQERSWLGAHFTPKPIVKAMIQVLSPKPFQAIYDPCAGGCGFLIETLDYIKTQNPSNEQQIAWVKRNGLLANEKYSQPYLLGVTNLALHGVISDNIKRTDALTLPNKGQNSFDIVVGSPPLGRLDRTNLYYHFEIESNTAELLFLQHFMASLKPGGKAAMLVSERVLFAQTKDFKAVKSKLLKEYNLHTILSLPPGALKPYSGVKTSVLFFKNDGPTESIWYYECQPEPAILSQEQLELSYLDHFVGSFNGRTTTEYSWAVDIKQLDSLDLTARNPHKAKLAELPTPQEILDKIRENDAKVNLLLDEVETLVKTG